MIHIPAQPVTIDGDEYYALRRDAARYRWLKANHLQTGADSWIRTGDDLEEAIDAGMRSDAAGMPSKERK